MSRISDRPLLSSVDCLTGSPISPSMSWLRCRGPSVRRHNTAAHLEEAEPDCHYEWVTPDESERAPFSRERAAILQLARRWDLCLSGDALLHIQQHGLEALFVPLVQVIEP